MSSPIALKCATHKTPTKSPCIGIVGLRDGPHITPWNSLRRSFDHGSDDYAGCHCLTLTGRSRPVAASFRIPEKHNLPNSRPLPHQNPNAESRQDTSKLWPKEESRIHQLGHSFGNSPPLCSEPGVATWRARALTSHNRRPRAPLISNPGPPRVYTIYHLLYIPYTLYHTMYIYIPHYAYIYIYHIVNLYIYIYHIVYTYKRTLYRQPWTSK